MIADIHAKKILESFQDTWRTDVKLTGYPSRGQLEIKCFQRKLDMAGTAIEMQLLLFRSIKRPFQIPVAHFDRNRTIKYQF